MNRARRGLAMYSLAFAVVDWLDASVGLLTLGQYRPGWDMRFAAWYALRSHRLKQRGRDARPFA